ncbi:YaeQ family protein [bacterium]|nr:YaeQ family protein [bacterium]
MAAKVTTVTAELDISDMERNYYRTHNLTLAQPQSETDERLMVRVLAFALQADDLLRFGEGGEEPALWVRDTAGNPEVWIEIGEPDEKRLQKACARAKQVIVYSYASSAQGWWNRIGAKADRDNLIIYHIQGVPTSRLNTLCQREMKLHCMVQDGQVWLTGGDETVQLDVATLKI